MEKLTKIFSDILLNMDCPSFFKEALVKDFSELEGQLNHIKLMYGVELEINVKPYEKPEGRWLGVGVVEQMATIAELYKNK